MNLVIYSYILYGGELMQLDCALSNDSIVKGSVKWFCDKRGYGFLKCLTLHGDVFAHHSEIVGQDGFKKLRKGQEVLFSVDIEHSQKKAKQIRLSDEA